MAISRNYRILIFGEVFKINTTHFSWNSFNVHFAVLLTLLILQQLCCLYMLLRLTEKQDKYCVDTDLSSNSTADCGALPLPVNGFLLPPYTNTTEGSVAAFQCDSGFVPEGVMTAVCESDGQWTPNSGNVICSPRPTPTSTQTTQTSTPTQTPIPTSENQFLLLFSPACSACKHKIM